MIQNILNTISRHKKQQCQMKINYTKIMKTKLFLAHAFIPPKYNKIEN